MGISKRGLAALPWLVPEDPGSGRYAIGEQLLELDSRRLKCLTVCDRACPPPGQPWFRCFLEPGIGFVNQIYDPGSPPKWSDKQLDKLLRQTWVSGEGYIFDLWQAERQLAEDWLKAQEAIRAAELKLKHIERQERRDTLMALVSPQLPAGLGAWLDDELFLEHRYGLYRPGSKQRIDVDCSYCGKPFLSERPQRGNLHGKAHVICPYCGSDLELRVKARSGLGTFWKDVLVLEKNQGFYILHGFNAHRGFQRFAGSGHEKNKNGSYFGDSLYEKSISFFDENFQHIESYYKGWVYGGNGGNGGGHYDWVRGKGAAIWSGYLYPGGIKEMLSGSKWQYSQAWTLAGSKRAFHVPRFFAEYKPVYEYLIKMGLYTFASQMVDMPGEIKVWGNGFAGKSVTERFGMDIESVRQAVRLDAGADMLKFLQAQSFRERRLSDQAARVFVGTRAHDLEVLADKVSLNRLAAYLGDIPPTDYLDYLGMAERLGYDLTDDFILFPRRFRQAHNEVTRLLEQREQMAENENIRATAEEYAWAAAFGTKALRFIIPQSAAEISLEGKLQHHCVGSYSHSVAAGQCLILFLRKAEEPDMPYYTVELDLKELTMRQCRGKNNSAMTPAVKKFMAAWDRNVLAPARAERRNAPRVTVKAG